MAEINQAYRTLIDPQARVEYDCTQIDDKNSSQSTQQNTSEDNCEDMMTLLKRQFQSTSAYDNK